MSVLTLPNDCRATFNRMAENDMRISMQQLTTGVRGDFCQIPKSESAAARIVFPYVPEDRLTDIFLHLTFAKQCSFRRTCRHWNRLLRSGFLCHTLVFDVKSAPSRRPVSVRQRSLTAALSRNVKSFNAVIIRGPPLSDPIASIYNLTVDGNFREVLSAIEDSAVEPAAPKRHLIIQRMIFSKPMHMATCIFSTVEFRQSRIHLLSFFSYEKDLSDFWNNQVSTYSHHLMPVMIPVIGPITADELTARGRFPYNDPARGQFVMENMAPLTAEQLMELQTEWPGCHRAWRGVVLRDMAKMYPSLNVPLDYSGDFVTFPTGVQRMLLSFLHSHNRK